MEIGAMPSGDGDPVLPAGEGAASLEGSPSARGVVASRARRYQEVLGLSLAFVAMFSLGRAFVELAFPLGLVVLFLAPVPLSAVFLRQGNREGLVASSLALAGVVAMTPAARVSAELAAFLPLMICGAVYGLTVNGRASLAQTLSTGTLVLSAMVMVLVYGSGLTDLALALEPAEGTPSASREAARAKLAPLAALLTPPPATEAAAGANKVAADRETFEAAFSFWFRFPLFFAAATALLVFGGYLYTVRRVLGQVGVVTPELWFTEWTVPWEYSWWLIAAIGMFLLTLLSDWEWGQCVASNVALLVALPYAVTTLSIAGYLLERRQVGPLFRWFVALVVLLNLPYLTLFAMLDPWVDYRRLATGEPETAEGLEDEDEE